jgi:SAM-dependent methyltransferase
VTRKRSAESITYFAGAAAHYAAETRSSVNTTRGWHRRVRTETVLEISERHAAPGALVADVGCGPAQMAAPLAGAGYRYVGIDPVPTMFAEAALELADNDAVQFQEGGAEAVPLGDGIADVVLLIGVIEYLPDRDRWLAEAHRVLRRGGVLIFSYPNLLNPVQLLRRVTRPVVAPLIRSLPLARSARGTVFASDSFHRPFLPWAPAADARGRGFLPIETVLRGYCMHLRSRAMDPGEAPSHLRREALGQRRFRWFGADVIRAMARA